MVTEFPTKDTSILNNANVFVLEAGKHGVPGRFTQSALLPISLANEALH